MENFMTKEQPTEPEFYSAFERGYASMQELNAAYRRDEDLRRRIDGGDLEPVAEAFGLDIPAGVDMRVVADTAEVFHLILPPDPNAVVADSKLSQVSGGNTAGSAGTVGSAGCFACSTSPSTISSLGSAGSAGSATGN